MALCGSSLHPGIPVAANFKLLLHTSGVSVSELARRIGEKRGTVHHWLARGVPPAQLFSVAEALDMTPDELRPYLSSDREDPQKMLEMEVDAFIERLKALPKAQRLAALERLFSIPDSDE